MLKNYVEDLVGSYLGIPPAKLSLVAGDWDAWRSQLELLLSTRAMRHANALQSTQLSSRPNAGQQRDVGRNFLPNVTRLRRNVNFLRWLRILMLMPSKSQTPFGKEIE